MNFLHLLPSSHFSRFLLPHAAVRQTVAQHRLTPQYTGTNLKLLQRDIREGEQISRDRPKSIALAM